jgi:hypothetical protein
MRKNTLFFVLHNVLIVAIHSWNIYSAPRPSTRMASICSHWTVGERGAERIFQSWLAAMSVVNFNTIVQVLYKFLRNLRFVQQRASTNAGQQGCSVCLKESTYIRITWNMLSQRIPQQNMRGIREENIYNSVSDTLQTLVSQCCPPMSIRVKIDPPHLLVCRKRRLNGAVLRMRPGKPTYRVTAGVTR